MKRFVRAYFNGPTLQMIETRGTPFLPGEPPGCTNSVVTFTLKEYVVEDEDWTGPMQARDVWANIQGGAGHTIEKKSGGRLSAKGVVRPMTSQDRPGERP